MDKSIKECTFKDYLMELQVSDDPAQAMQDVKTAARNPDRYAKQRAADIVTKERNVKQATDNPTQREELMLIQKQKIAAMAAKQLADKIEYLINNPHKRKLMGRESRKRYKKFFTEEIMIGNLKKVFGKVIAE